ncbi:hypothetical protein SacmaDRAFT_2159 [Saccharomonospora marina XMU15]|uniref:Allophanate hydrolase C-terminal domain-containing protein n=1 Tax=Saccharomonospora marina XMU15 TaxID=882083 RepID=H5XAI3_9PSEU|nr:hypothetical protein [Saccharomonospora marina]EHR50413.1 hypothetical protein SacmaDRAFT_2159 [Saccharomonospora marina XMU15]
MNPFPIDDDTVPIPPVSSYQRVVAAYDGLARAGRPEPWLTIRSREDTLIEAKAVDERVRAGEEPPLAGVAVAVPDIPLFGQRLVRAGAVVLGTTAYEPPGRVPTLETVDAVVVGALPRHCGDLVAFMPTRGLVPLMSAMTVLARDIDVAQRVAAALTGPDACDPEGRDWPASVRLAAGEHPSVAVPGEPELVGLAPESRADLAATVDTLRATGAVVNPVRLRDMLDVRAGYAATLLGNDALLLPGAGTRPALAELAARLDAAVVVLPGGHCGTGVLAKAFDDQVAIDIAALLTSANAATPYPAVGVELIAFGAYLRGQPDNGELTRFGARFAGFVETAPRYRMIALGGGSPNAGVFATEDGARLLGERWLISPAALSGFATRLPAPLTLGGVELADGRTATGILCDDAAAEGTDVTSFGCWRAYLRHLSTQRPVEPPAPD